MVVGLSRSDAVLHREQVVLDKYRVVEVVFEISLFQLTSQLAAIVVTIVVNQRVRVRKA